MKRNLLSIQDLMCLLPCCAHQEEVLLDRGQEPKHVLPNVPSHTLPDHVTAKIEADKRQYPQGAVADGSVSAIFLSLINMALGSDKEERREKRWKRSRTHELLVRKDSISKRAKAPRNSWS